MQGKDKPPKAKLVTQRIKQQVDILVDEADNEYA